MNTYTESSFLDSEEDSYFPEAEYVSYFDKLEESRKPRVSSLQMRRRIEDAEERRRMRELYDFEDFDF